MQQPSPGRSHWVEFYGGPYDGAMTELPWRFIPETQNMGIYVAEPETPLGDDWYRPGPKIGTYRAAVWADEDLGIVRMDWDRLQMDEKAA